MPASASSRCTASTLGLEGVDAQVQRRRLQQGFGQRPELGVGQLLAQRAGQPVGQVVAQLVRQRRGIDRAAAFQPHPLVRLERALQEALGTLPAEDGQAPLRRASGALRQVLEQQPPAQHGVGGLGQRVALARTQVAVGAEEGRHHAVGRSIELQHLADQLGARSSSEAGCIAAIIPCPLCPADRPAAAARRRLAHDAVLDAQRALDEPAHRQRVDAVLGGAHARGQRVGVVVRQHRHHRLQHDRPVVELGVTKCTVAPATLQPASMRAPVRVQAREGRQQRRMDVQQAALVAPHEGGAEDAHEAGQHHQVGRDARRSPRPARRRRPRGWRRRCGRPPRWRCRALRRTAGPAASARLLITAATRAGQASAAQRCTMASMLEPRPEIRMTMRFIGAV